MFTLYTADRKQAEENLDGLVELLGDLFKEGESVDSSSPPSNREIEDYWKRKIAEISPDNRILIIGVNDAGDVAASAQLVFSPELRTLERAELHQVLVHSRYRKTGLGKQLGDFVEDTAHSKDVKVLVVDPAIGELK